MKKISSATSEQKLILNLATVLSKNKYSGKGFLRIVVFENFYNLHNALKYYLLNSGKSFMWRLSVLQISDLFLYPIFLYYIILKNVK